MDTQVTQTAHSLNGPHLELRPDDRAEFTPLKLTVQPGSAKVELTQQEAIFGRHSEADVRLAFAEISRRHCRVFFENGQWRIVDLDSLNGLWINGERMHEAVLYKGDKIRIGFCVITVEQGTSVRVITSKQGAAAEEVLQNALETLPPRQAG